MLDQPRSSLQQGAFDESVADGLAAFFAKALARDATERFDNPQDMTRAWELVFTEAQQRDDGAQPRRGGRSGHAGDPAGPGRAVGQGALRPRAVRRRHRRRPAGAPAARPLPDRGRDPVHQGRDRPARPSSGAAASPRPPSRRRAASTRWWPSCSPTGRRPRRTARSGCCWARSTPSTGAGPLAWPTGKEVANELDVPLADVTGPWQAHLARGRGHPDGRRAARPGAGRCWRRSAAPPPPASSPPGCSTDAARTRPARTARRRRTPWSGSRSSRPPRSPRRCAGWPTPCCSRPAHDLDQTSADENLDAAPTAGRGRPGASPRASPWPRPATVLDRLRETADGTPLQELADARLRDLAAAAGGLAVSARGELYPRGMPAARALRLAAGALVAGPGGLHERTVQSRVRARFPEAQALPGRPGLDRLLRDAGVDLVWRGDGYLPETAPVGSRSSVSATGHGDAGADAARAGRRRAASQPRRAGLPRALGRAPLRRRRARPAAARARPGRGRRQRLAGRRPADPRRRTPARTGSSCCAPTRTPPPTPTGRSWTASCAACWSGSAAHVAAQPGPVLLTGAGVLARHGCADLLAPLASQTTSHPHATWLLAPQPERLRQPHPGRRRRPDLVPDPVAGAAHPLGADHPRRSLRLTRSPTVTVDQRALLTDLQKQVRSLEDDIRERAASTPGGRRAAPGRARPRARGRPHRDDVRRVARQPGRPGGGRVGAGHGLRPLLRGQRPGRRRLALRARATGCARRGSGRPSSWSPSRTSTTATGCWPAFAHLASLPGGGRALRHRPQPALPAGDLRRRRREPCSASGGARDDARGAGPRLHRPRPVHPLPRRPLPGPLRGGPQGSSPCCRPRSSSRSSSSTSPSTRRSRRSGSTDLKLIDPTCGSGHFLLGAFDRLLDALGPGSRPAWTCASGCSRRCDSVHGVDINPFATAIARFRLTVAALKAVGPDPAGRRPGLPAPPRHRRLAAATARTEARALRRRASAATSTPPRTSTSTPSILKRGRYHVVVGNPPYITVKDKALNEAYRERLRDLLPASTRCRCRSPSSSSGWPSATPTGPGTSGRSRRTRS